MKKRLLIASLCMAFALQGVKAETPWQNGKLQVSANHRFLQYENGKPFFWLGDTGWLLPERLNREEVAYYFKHCADECFNVVQMQVMNEVPSYNVYGQMSLTDGFDFSRIDRQGVYGYWNHIDYIVDEAARNGVYVGMVCIWGSNVKSEKMNAAQAVAYGRFLSNRYKDRPNIVWIMGGDIQGDIHPEVWDSLAMTIKSIDANHLMTYHPRGRTTSAKWFNSRAWLDFNMFQSGHRRYDQPLGDKKYTIPYGTEEDNWQFVDSCAVRRPLKPVIDGEPAYEGIPQGLHDPTQPRWKAADVRRYAYWSVFAGACGHTYGNNAIMQFAKPGYEGAYGADCAAKPWYKAMEDEGYHQMKYVKRLMLMFPYFDRVADQSIVSGSNGVRYDRLAATRGSDYLMVYNYTGRSMVLNLDRISGKYKKIFIYNPMTGAMKAAGRVRSSDKYAFANDATGDYVFIAVDDAAKFNFE